MYTVSKETLEKAYKPYDIVTDRHKNVGYISEVNINDCQEGFEDQISYSINWLVGNQDKIAWWDHKELTRHCNLFVKIAESSTHPMGDGERWVKPLLGIK